MRLMKLVVFLLFAVMSMIVGDNGVEAQTCSGTKTLTYANGCAIGDSTCTTQYNTQTFTCQRMPNPPSLTPICGYPSPYIRECYKKANGDCAESVLSQPPTIINCDSTPGDTTCHSEPANNVTGFKCVGTCANGKTCFKDELLADCKCIGGGSNGCAYQGDDINDENDPNAACGGNCTGSNSLPGVCTLDWSSSLNKWQCPCVDCTNVAPTWPNPKLVSPTNDSKQDTATVTLDWNGVSSWGKDCNNGQRGYKIFVGRDSSVTTYLMWIAAGTTQYNWEMSTDDLDGEWWYWQVVATNGSTLTVASPVWRFRAAAKVGGRVFETADNNCSNGTGTDFDGLTATLGTGTNTYTDVVGGAGWYSIIAKQGTYGHLQMNPQLPTGYQCATGTGCPSCPDRLSTASPSTGNNFYFTSATVPDPLRNPWWQAAGAGVYAGSLAGGNVIVSELPDADARLIVPGTAGEEGAVVRGSGNVDLGGNGGALSESQWSAISTYSGPEIDYQYLASQMGVTSSTTNDWGGDSINKLGTGKKFYYIDPASGTVDLSEPWQVFNGGHIVVFVDGDLLIDENVTVANGGFLAFVVRGSINIDPAVTTVEGLYIADSNLIVNSNGSVDVPLSANGSFTAWGSVSLNRDLDTDNFSTPAVVFSYRPDLIVNMPDDMRTYALQWSEVVPGTYGD